MASMQDDGFPPREARRVLRVHLVLQVDRGAPGHRHGFGPDRHLGNSETTTPLSRFEPHWPLTTFEFLQAPIAAPQLTNRCQARGVINTATQGRQLREGCAGEALRCTRSMKLDVGLVCRGHIHRTCERHACACHRRKAYACTSCQ